MKGKLKFFLMIVSIVVLVSVGSFFMGKQVEEKNTLYGQQVKNAESTQIAVINQDLGINYKEKNVNYALDLVKSLDSDFILTNRESAKKGIEDGKYGAMVIIPGNFSQNITTVNDVTPSKVQIYYETNDKLGEENKLIVSAKVSDFEKKLNNKLSYMYITSVFDEVHKGQDYASDILKNDSTDLDAINSINDSDILESINLTVLEDENIDLTDLDLNKNFEENKNIIQEIDKKYRDRLLAKEASFEGIKDELLKVTGNSSTGIKSFRSEIENMTPEQLKVALAKKHNYNYDSLSSNYDVNVDGVNKYVEDLTKEAGGIDNLVGTYNEDVLSEVDKKGKSAIKQSNENLSKVKETTDANIDMIQNNAIGRLNGLKSNIINGNGNDPKLQSLNEEYLLYGEMVRNLRKTNPGAFENVYKNVVDGNKVDYSKILKDPTAGLAPSNTFANWNDLKSYIANVPVEQAETAVLARSSKYKGIDVNDLTLSVNAKLADSIIYDLKGVQDNLKETSTSTDKIMNDLDYKYINDLFSEDTKIPLDEKLKLKESLIKEIKENLGGDNQKLLVSNIKKNNMENIGSIQKKVETEVEKVVADDGPIDVNGLLTIFDKNYMSRFDNIIKQIDELDKTDSTVDKDKEITSLWNKYDNSDENLNKSVTKQLDDYNKVVENSRENADKHVTTMQEDLDKGIQASQVKIASSLENVKATKTNTTNSNQEKLGSLSAVLVNSRVGTVENTDVYNFMINPVSAIESKDIAANIVKPQQGNDYEVKVLSVIGIIILLITGTIYKRKTKMNIN